MKGFGGHRGEPNMGFHHDAIMASALNQHAISFQSGAINGISGMIPMGSSLGINGTAGMILGGNSSIINNPGMNPAGNSSGGLHLDSVPGHKHDNGLASEWSVEEQCILEEGLVKYAVEPNIMKYIKIAATLRNKTVRDVALRCRWMTKKESGKRRKPEEHNMGKKIKDRKEKLVESSSVTSVPLIPPLNMAAYSRMPHMEHNDRMSFEVPAVGSTTRNLLDENAQVFSQIAANLDLFKGGVLPATVLSIFCGDTFASALRLQDSMQKSIIFFANTGVVLRQIQDNIDLLRRTRNNITAILNDMRDMPGIMSEMPPLHVSINEELANSILPNTAQAMMFGLPSGMTGVHMKQEPRC
ncbi:hypothetical protein HHK36_006607 [Tetracentron sinense]|uniref:Uncharacterized protein n=1 Tax=Tetracentron sinense TaxID=13715 RepID=A0A835DL01_TETSI|nr:hypothetical protein HHK36_006607 [Tetracentron sinense]